MLTLPNARPRKVGAKQAANSAKTVLPKTVQSGGGAAAEEEVLSRLLTAPPPRENCEPQKGGQAVSGPLAVVEVEAAEPWRSMALTRPSQRPLPRTAPATPTPAMAAGTAAPATAARKAALLLQLAPLPGRWEEASEAPPLAERTERTPAAKLRCQHRRRMRRGQERARSQRGKPPVLRRGGASRVQRRLTGAVVEVEAAEPCRSMTLTTTPAMAAGTAA